MLRFIKVRSRDDEFCARGYEKYRSPVFGSKECRSLIPLLLQCPGSDHRVLFQFITAESKEIRMFILRSNISDRSTTMHYTITIVLNILYCLERTSFVLVLPNDFSYQTYNLHSKDYSTFCKKKIIPI